MQLRAWPCPLPAGGESEELALVFDDLRRWRLLIVPALFDEGNRMRRFTAEVMRRLDGAGVDSFLIDLPGTNESNRPPETHTLEHWRGAVAAAAAHFRASHVLGIRGGALLLPPDCKGWAYAPVAGAALLRQLLRARIAASREAGRSKTQPGLLAGAGAAGLELAGYRLGGEMLTQLQVAARGDAPHVAVLDQEMLGEEGGLWLRAEPDEAPAQADALAAILALGIKS